jgi:cation-transporting P-type ATPase F
MAQQPISTPPVSWHSLPVEEVLKRIASQPAGLTLQVTVLRDGRRVVVPAESVVPGDIVFLHSGDKIPADLRLIQVKNLQTQEAALTGESVAVEKTRGRCRKMP